MSVRHRLVSLLVAGLAAQTATATHAATLDEAFSQGRQWGSSGNAAARGGINPGAAAATVPGYAPTAPAASYYGGAGLGTPSAAALAACAAKPADPACQAMNFTQRNPGLRPSFTIDASNPMLTRSRAITADPASIAGSLAGAYSACTTQTITSADIFANRICNEYRTVEQNTCTRTLNVTVTDLGLSCNAGEYLTANPRIMLIRPVVFVGAICAEEVRFQWYWGYSECNGISGGIYHISVMPSPELQRQLVDLGCGGAYYVEGGCAEGNCSYSVGIPNGNTTCTSPCDDSCCAYEYADLPLAGFNFPQPVHTYSVSDAWDNQCTALDARLP